MAYRVLMHVLTLCAGVHGRRPRTGHCCTAGSGRHGGHESARQTQHHHLRLAIPQLLPRQTAA